MDRFRTLFPTKKATASSTKAILILADTGFNIVDQRGCR